MATALTWDGIGPIISVQLKLVPVTLPCVPTISQVVDSLEDLTALVGNHTACYIPYTCCNMYTLSTAQPSIIIMYAYFEDYFSA